MPVFEELSLVEKLMNGRKQSSVQQNQRSINDMPFLWGVRHEWKLLSSANIQIFDWTKNGRVPDDLKTILNARLDSDKELHGLRIWLYEISYETMALLDVDMKDPKFLRTWRARIRFFTSQCCINIEEDIKYLIISDETRWNFVIYRIKDHAGFEDMIKNPSPFPPIN